MRIRSVVVSLIVLPIFACTSIAPAEGEGERTADDDVGSEGEGESSGEGEGEGALLEEPDANAPDNASRDVDCDGLSDAEEFGTLWPGGARTDPGDADSDDDGVTDGVEAGRSATVDARCGDRFVADADPTTRTNPTAADHDGDGLVDGDEDTNANGTLDPGESNPLSADSDGDGFCDGPADVAGACVGNDDPTATADGDGDGLPDRLDASPSDPDNDDDGLCDGGASVTGVCTRGEDVDNDGLLDDGESDPARADVDCDGLNDAQEAAAGTDAADPDSDDDGLLDGVELGSGGSTDPACAGAGVDADPSSTSDPRNPDADGDGLLDGQEDSNGNGAVDAGELDPRDPTDGGDPVVQAACSEAGLIPLRPLTSLGTDIQITVDGRSNAFAESGTVDVGGVEHGAFGFDAGSSVAFVAIARDPAGGDALVDEVVVRDLLNGVAPLGPPIVQGFTTWDGFPAASARYDQGGNTGLKARMNAIAAVLAPGVRAPFDVGSDVNAAGVRLEVEVVRRSADQTVVVVAALPLPRADTDDLFALRNIVDGSALGRARDGQGPHCEKKDAVGFSSVDIVWAVDNSSSMADEQAAVAAAAQAFVDKLGNSTVDWRASVVTSAFYSPGNGAGCTNTVCADATTSQCRSFTRDASTLAAGFTQTSPAWVGAGGSCNQSREAILRGAQLVLSDNNGGLAAFVPPSSSEDANKLRAGADLLVILLGDADDQFFVDADAAAGIDSYEGFFRGLPARVSIGGILCPEDQVCGEDQRTPRVARAVVNRFGGVIGTLNDLAGIPAAIDAIIDAAIADASPYVLARDAISASVKVSLADGSTLGTCNTADVPRSRVDGFDVDARTRTINFFGACRPVADGTTIAVSYRTWQPAPPVVDRACHCGCGGGLSCVDDGGDECACSCTQQLTCNAGFAFDDASCGCVCDVTAAAALCPATHALDPTTCACVCRVDCGGCASAETCQPSLCTCSGIGG